jgi:hypothetical protein
MRGASRIAHEHDDFAIEKGRARIYLSNGSSIGHELMCW